MSNIDDGEMQKILEFYVNNPDWDQMKSRINRFNPLKILGVQEFEIRHSNMLAWLFNPQGHHGLQDKIFKRVICEILKENEQMDVCSNCENSDCKYKNVNDSISINEIIMSDFSDLEIHREWNNIDIVAISTKNRMIVVLENKFNSSESNKQLVKYYYAVEDKFKKYKKIFVFLTLDGSEPNGCKKYMAFTHSQIYRVLINVVALNKEYINPKVLDFIGYYLKVLEEKSMSDEPLKELCRKIYKEHKEAIDLIVEYGRPRIPQKYMDDFHKKTQTKSVYQNNNNTSNNSKTNIIYGFMPEDWFEHVPDTNLYTSDKYLIIFSFDFSAMDKKKIQLRLEIGNFRNKEVRKKFIQEVNNKRDELPGDKKIINKAAAEQATYSRIKSINIDLKDVDIDEYDEIILKMELAYKKMEEVREVMSSIIKAFDFSEERTIN